MLGLKPAWRLSWLIVIINTFLLVFGHSPKPVYSVVIIKEAEKYLHECSTYEAIKAVKSVAHLYQKDTLNSFIRYVNNIENILLSARAYYNRNNYENAYERFSSLFEICKNSIEVVHKTIDTATKLKKYDNAISWVTKVVNKNVKNSDPVMNSVIALYSRLGHLEATLGLIENYLNLDPDNVKVMKKYKKIRSIKNHISNLKDCYNGQKDNPTANYSEECLKHLKEISSDIMLKFIDDEQLFSTKATISAFRCLIFNGDNKNYRNIKAQCELALSLISEDPKATSYSRHYKKDIYISLARAMISLKKYKNALDVIETALREFYGDQKLSALLMECKSLVENGSDEDYYTILGVSKNATTKQITSAYRKLAMKNHPDRKKEGPERDEAMEDMAKINKAKEVLSDPQKRQEYDNRGLHHGFFGDSAYNSGGGSFYFNNQDRPGRFIIRNGDNIGGEQFFIRFSPNNQRVVDPFSHIIENIFGDSGF